MIEVSEKYFAFGKNTFMREVVIPVGEVIEDIAREHPCTDEIDLKITPRPTAFFSGLEALIGISIYLAGWAGNKFLDEIYDAKLGPAIKSLLKTYIEKAGSDKKYSLAILARNKGSMGSALICCVGSSINEIESSEKHIPAIVTIAENFLKSSNDSSIYLFVIDSGKVNLEPEVYETHEKALEGLKRMYPAKMPARISPPKG